MRPCLCYVRVSCPQKPTLVLGLEWQLPTPRGVLRLDPLKLASLAVLHTGLVSHTGSQSPIGQFTSSLGICEQSGASRRVSYRWDGVS